MPRTGRPPKPVELKRRLGNPGKRPLPAPVVSIAPIVSTASVPAFASGDEMLQHVLDAGASTWIGPTDAAMASLARRLWDDAALAQARWAASGDPEAFRAYRDTTKELIACLSALGLDPASRGRLGVAAVKAQNALESMMVRRRLRSG